MHQSSRGQKGPPLASSERCQEAILLTHVRAIHTNLYLGGMSHYLQMGEEEAHGVWHIDGARAKRIDTSNLEFNAQDGDGLAEIRRSYPAATFHRLELAPGHYYPRMARSTYPHIKDRPGANPANEAQRSLIETGRGQLVALRSELQDILRVVHPVAENFDAYGHSIRNLLILAATEVETYWKGIFAANGAEARNTHDYVKLADAMRLPDYAIKLPHYPWLEPIRPFEKWRPSQTPTQDLSWYDAYNGVKHNREEEFSRATLMNVLKAVCGCAVMTFAQFGSTGFHRREDLNTFFNLTDMPVWAPHEVYVPPYSEAGITPVNYPFPA